MGQGLRRARRAFALLAAAAVLAVPAALAGDQVELVPATAAAPSADLTAVIPNAYFVELAGTPASFRSQAKKVGLNYTERYSYGRLFNGISVSVAPGQRSKLEGIGVVKAIYPVFTAELEPTSTPDLATAVAMTGADLANGSGFTGAGVKVAVMDTGVDYDHPDLGGCFGPGCRVVAGHDFVGDAFNATQFLAIGVPNPTYSPTPVPDPDPDDCNGHGTHVAGIVGAKAAGASGVSGVAPDVTFGAYRVFGCEGSTTADIMLAAMEAALEDGMHILNMSIGSAFQTWPQYPTAAAADALVEAGMVVVTSIGNSGADGLYSAGAPGVGNHVIGTASYDNSHVSALTFNTSGGRQVPYLPITTTDEPPTSGTTPEVVYIGRGCPMSGPSWSLPADDPLLADPAGKVALMDRGTCTFAAKYDRAVAAGAVDVVIANNSTGLFAGGGVVGQPGISAIAISLADGNAMKAEIAAGPTTLTWTDVRVNAVNPTGGLLSSFTSYGMNAELTLKPDIGAPGGLIRSTYPLERGAYAIVSGTSMASPHVAGAAALLKQARPLLGASQFRTILQNSADPKNWSGNPGLGFLDFVHRQGAGMVDIDDAIMSTATVTPGKLSLGEGSGGTHTLTVANSGSSAVTYTLSHVQALTTGPGPFPGFGIFAGGVTASFSAPTVTVPAGGTATVDVTINASGVGDLSQYGGYVVLTPTGGAPLRVPYAGLKGDYQAIQALRIAAVGRVLPSGALEVLPTGGTFTLQGNDIPNVFLGFGHQSRRLELEVVHAATGKRLHPVFSNMHEEDYLPRNATANTVFAFDWDGTRMHDNGVGTPDHRKTVPDGSYKIVAKVLKALGDPANPAHWETWTSPTITIDRP